MSSFIIVVLNQYIKKDEARESFKKTRLWLTVLGMLIALEPFLFWLLVNMLMENLGMKHLTLPFILENNFLIACSVVLIGVLLIIWLYSWKLPQRMFEEKFAEYADHDDNYLIKKSALMAKPLWLFFLPLMFIGALGGAYLYLSMTSLQALHQILDQLRPLL